MDVNKSFKVLDESACETVTTTLPSRTLPACRSPVREPLCNIPVRPLNKRPILKPLCDATSGQFTPSKGDPLTPPYTPVKPCLTRSSSDLSDASVDKNQPQGALGGDAHSTDEAQALLAQQNADQSINQNKSWLETSPLAIIQDYEFIFSSRDRLVEYGRGAWSIVYTAQSARNQVLKDNANSTCGVSIPQSGLPTPQTTPRNSLLGGKPPQLFAVKTPSHRRAQQVIGKEAKILTWLRNRSLRYSDFVVDFYGYDAEKNHILLSAITLDLEQFATSAGKAARSSTSILNVSDPVIGLRAWEELAIHLVDGLSFLREARCVHGDIKPQNILLKSNRNSTGNHVELPHSQCLQYIPVYIDFSSSHICSEDSTTQSASKDEEISAVTPTFTDPALLAALRSKEVVIATYANDLYALAVTLLFAAIGECPYSCASSSIQKQIMAKEGRPLDFARSGDMATRISKGGLIDRCLARSFDKGDARWDLNTWRETLKTLFARRG